MLTIYDITGAVRLKTAINIGSKRVFRLMGDDYITLHFSLKTPIAFRLGDYCDVPGFGRFELCAPYKPTYGVQTGAFDYELKLEAQHMKWRNKIMRFLPSAGAAECSWALTATATTHLEQVLANIKSLAYDGADSVNGGYLYCYLSDGQTSGKDYEMDVDGSVDGSAKTISYDNTSILDALSSIAETFDCEWWLDDNIIRLGKCELNNDYIDLEIGKNVADMPHTGSKEDYATRLLVFGGERNISPRYRKELIFTVTEVTHGGSRILDGTRLLKSAWFSDGQRVSVSTVRKSAAFSSNGSKAVGSTGSAEVPVFTETREIANVGADRWKAVLSEFRPVMIITGDKGAATHVKFTVAFRGTASDGSSFFKETYDQGYIQSAGKAVTASFADVALEISSEVDVLSVSLSYSVIMSGAGSVSVSYSPGSQSAVVIESAGSIERVDGIVIEKLGEDGSVEDTYNGAVLNPDGSEDIYEGSTIELPSPVRMSVGHRFRIANIIESRVKSSYFISKYAAFSQSSDTAVYGIASSRLMLPESYGKPYVDYSEGMTMPEGVEKVVVFDDIYPKAECHVTAVSTVERKETVENDDGTTVNKTFTAYCVKDDFFTSARPFSSDYIIPDHKLEITFKDGRRYKESDIIPAGSSVGELVNPESGKLNGWTFEVQFSRDSDGSAIWEIVRDDTSYIPNEIIKPEIGDTFVITGCDISVVDELMVDAAEEELLETARRYVEEMNTDPTTYSCTISTAALKGGLSLGIGKRVNLINPGCFESRTEDGRVWGRKSRIIGYETFLDKPFDKAIYTVGEKAAYSRFGEIEDKIKAMTASGRSSASGGSGRGVYVIGTDDSTAPTDTNVYSALRSNKEYLSRLKDDVAQGKLTFRKGLESLLAVFAHDSVGSPVFRDGFTGEGWQAWTDAEGLARLTVDKLTVRQTMEVFELIVAKIRAVGGQLIVSAADGKIKTVEDLGSSYRITFEDENTFAAHDLMRCQVFTGSSIKSYWVEVAEADAEGITVEKSEFGDAVPEEGDECVLMGNTSNTDRQNLISISATEDGQPRIDVLNGVHAKNFNGCLRARFGNLDGISDAYFPIDNQPHGDGLYADNAYLHGTFILADTGDNVSTLFQIINGRLTSLMSSVEEVREGLVTANSSFLQGGSKWSCGYLPIAWSIDGAAIAYRGSWLTGGGVIPRFESAGGVPGVTMRRGWIRQDCPDYLNVPELKEVGGKKQPLKIRVMLKCLVTISGEVTVRFYSESQSDMPAEYAPFVYRGILSASGEEQTVIAEGEWSGTGDFLVEMRGGMHLRSAIVEVDGVGTLYRAYQTLFEQTDNLVRLTAAVFGEDKRLLTESGLVVAPGGSGMYAVNGDGSLASIGVSVEEEGESVVKISGDKICLDGAVSQSGGFGIDESGNMYANGGTFGGYIRTKWAKVTPSTTTYTADSEQQYYRLDKGYLNILADVENDEYLYGGDTLNIQFPTGAEYQGAHILIYDPAAARSRNGPFPSVCVQDGGMLYGIIEVEATINSTTDPGVESLSLYPKAYLEFLGVPSGDSQSTEWLLIYGNGRYSYTDPISEETAYGAKVNPNRSPSRT